MARDAWKSCPLCGKVVRYKPGPFETNEKMWIELGVRMDKHQLNMCNICTKSFGSCDSKPVFGDCVGNDNVVECSSFKWR